MTFNRNNQILALDKLYKSNENQAVVFYSNTGSDIHEVIKEFIKDKDFFYYKAVQVSEDEQVKLFVNSINEQLANLNISEISYDCAIKTMMDLKCEKRVVIIDEFQHIVKYSDNLMNNIVKCINNKWGNQPVLFILVSTNSYFVENHMVNKLDDLAYEISGIIKLPDLSFIDIVRNFERYSKSDQIVTYGITGGKYEIIRAFNPDKSLKENIINEILNSDGSLYKLGYDILPKELREHSVYNTILVNIASGLNKLNDLHKATGYSRAKISVYLNNLTQHDLIEKIDSIDTEGRENTLKGIYTIKNCFLEFFYRFIYKNVSMLDVIGEEKFYKKYILPYLNDFAAVSFRKVCYEYLLLLKKMGNLPLEIDEFGTWLGKVGNIDIVAKNSSGNALIGLCEFKKDIMSFEDFEWLEFCVAQAKLKADVYYLFSKKDFDERIKEYAEKTKNIVLVDLTML